MNDALSNPEMAHKEDDFLASECGIRWLSFVEKPEQLLVHAVVHSPDRPRINPVIARKVARYEVADRQHPVSGGPRYLFSRDPNEGFERASKPVANSRTAVSDEPPPRSPVYVGEQAIRP